MPSVPSNNTGQFSQTTWGRAKQKVARVAGSQDDPDMISLASESISDAFRYWNGARAWSFLLVGPYDIALTGGTQAYDLPTNFWKPYYAVLLTNKRTLSYIDRRGFGRMLAGDESVQNPWWYTCYDTAASGKIQVLPTGIGDTLRVFYYRPMSVNGSDDGATLDILDTYEPALLDSARARILADAGGSQTRLQFFMEAAKIGIAQAIGDDSTKPDRNTAIYSIMHDNTMPIVAPSEISNASY